MLKLPTQGSSLCAGGVARPRRARRARECSGPLCVWTVCVHCLCALCVHCLCTLCVHCVCILCALCGHCVHCLCLLCVHCVCTVCVYSVCTVCVLCVHCLCELCVHCMCTVCALCVCTATVAGTRRTWATRWPTLRASCPMACWCSSPPMASWRCAWSTGGRTIEVRSARRILHAVHAARLL